MQSNKTVKQTFFDSSSNLDTLFTEIYNKTFEQIKKICESTEQKLGELSVIKYASYYLIMNGNIELIFTSPKKVIIKNGFIGNIELQIIDENVISTVQINYIIKENKIENLYILNEKNEWIKYEGQTTLIDLLSEVEDLNFKCDKHIPEFKFNDFCVASLTKVKKQLLSQYFSLYFKNDDNQNEYLEFFQTKNREKLSVKIMFFIKSPINIFKMTGPSSNGKSMTLLYYSRCVQNVVYLNLKTLIRLEEKDKMIEIFLYELQRINLAKDEINNVSNIFLESKEFWSTLYSIIDKLKDKKIVFILDQFSKSTINEDIYQKIRQLIKGKSIKLILCSSINNNIIKDEVIKTLIKNKGNPRTFKDITQEYYYYFVDLINLEQIKERYNNNKNKEIYELFNFCYKYIKLINEEKSENKLNSIMKMIYNKIDSSFKKEFIDYKYILIHLQNYIKKNINYEESELYLKQTPLKYFKLILYENYFQIDYQFPFIKIISDNCLSENEVNKYFQNKDYLVPDKEVNKGIYFERAVKYKIKKSYFLPNEINKILKVDSIITFNTIEENNNKINKLSQFLSDKNEEIEKEEENINKKKIIKTQYKDIKKPDKKKILQKKRSRDKSKDDKNFDKIQEKEYIKNEYKLDESKKILKNDAKNEIIIHNKEEEEDDINSKGILIEQDYSNGALIDLGFLFGEGNKKTFIGFQMKNYGKNTDLKDKDKEKFTKENIKKSLLLMNYNIKKSFSVNINEFHFFFVLYFNNEDKDRYSKNLVKFCNSNDIKYILYNPVLQTFYNEQEKEIESLILDRKSNVDFYSKVNPYTIFKNMRSNVNNINYLKDENPELTLKKLLQKDESKKDLAFLQFKQKLKNINNEIKSLEVLGLFEIKFYELMVFPKHSYGLLFDDGKNYFYYIFNFKEEISFYKISKIRYAIEKVNMVDIIRDKKTETVIIIKSYFNS